MAAAWPQPSAQIIFIVLGSGLNDDLCVHRQLTGLRPSGRHGLFRATAPLDRQIAVIALAGGALVDETGDADADHRGSACRRSPSRAGISQPPKMTG